MCLGLKSAQNTVAAGPTMTMLTLIISTRGTPSSTRRLNVSMANTPQRSNRTWREEQPCNHRDCYYGLHPSIHQATRSHPQIFLRCAFFSPTVVIYFCFFLPKFSYKVFILAKWFACSGKADVYLSVFCFCFCVCKFIHFRSSWYLLQ